MFLDSLPPEIIINILRYCDVKTLYAMQLVNREMLELLNESENTVYRAAALYHGFISPSEGVMSLEDVSRKWVGITTQVGKEFGGWKDVCEYASKDLLLRISLAELNRVILLGRRLFELEYNWEGRGRTPKTTLLRSTGRDVHRFKLDERKERRFVITTHRRGGLKVVCMDTDTVLFELGRVSFARIPHTSCVRKADVNITHSITSDTSRIASTRTGSSYLTAFIRMPSRFGASRTSGTEQYLPRTSYTTLTKFSLKRLDGILNLARLQLLRVGAA